MPQGIVVGAQKFIYQFSRKIAVFKNLLIRVSKIHDIVLPFEMVDVNVHPRKGEIRFKNENLVLEIMEKTILNLLDQYNLTYKFFSTFPFGYDRVV